MLQIVKIALLSVSFCLCSLSAELESGGAVDWFLEEALDEEVIQLEQPSISLPRNLQDAIEYYESGNYSVAAEIINKYIEMHLPDGRADFVTFLLGECYREMGLKDLAALQYRYILDRFPNSDKIPFSYFRLLQYAYRERNGIFAENALTVFRSKYASHPLFNSVLYLAGKLFYRTERYEDAAKLLLDIPVGTSRHFQAQFLTALCFVKQKNPDKALFHMEYIRRHCTDGDILSESDIVTGDIYMLQKKYETALGFYQSVPKNALRYHYALVKTVRAYAEMEDFRTAEKTAKRFMERNRQSPYFFEMAAVLEQVYFRMGEKEKAATINRIVYKQIVEARLTFKIKEELACVFEIMRRWRGIEFSALRSKDDKLLSDALKNIDKLVNLEKKHRALLYNMGDLPDRNIGTEIPGLAERRYLRMLQWMKTELDNRIVDRTIEYENTAAKRKEGAPDSVFNKIVKVKKEKIDSMRIRLSEIDYEYSTIKRLLWESRGSEEKLSNEMQAKFIDWAFGRYIEKKEELARINEEITKGGRKSETRDSLADKGSAVVSLFSSIDRDKLAESIVNDRNRLVEHCITLIDASSVNPYFPQILMRLAELYYDEASDEFARRLEVYEKMLAEGRDSAGMEFPEYDLSKVLKIYDRIISEYPEHPLADDAYFYSAMALQKIGENAQANDVLFELIERYPESEYFVEANMAIGRYYFEHPKVDDDAGYKNAEDAYRRVLYYRDHPQFVEALYHLGWCYYMQDRFEEAISVFKYLVEEVDLDFDPRKIEEKQVVNPLLRDEAVDYIAISFDEEGNIDDAVRFLQLIGNMDYAALVLKRIGELREEDLDYENALKVYRRLMAEYPNSSVAPDASVNMIKIFETTNKPDLAMREREDFFAKYSRGTGWHKEIVIKDTSRIMVVDSIAISIGLYVADEQYRKAELKNDIEMYRRAIDNYGRLVNAYPDHPQAAAARWNLAVLLEKKTNQDTEAYEEYLKFSRFEEAGTERREQAALNAVAIAQRRLPPDTLIAEGKLEASAVKVIEAARNYIEQFQEGKSFSDVILTMGSIYFNRKMFANAIKTYSLIIDKGKNNPKYFQARYFIARCYFGEENWVSAAQGFEDVWKESPDTEMREEALKMLLQSMFLYAKQIFASGDYLKAAVEYEAIDNKFPGSEYGDVVLFNAAESYEKIEDWKNACRSYQALYKKYPRSKFAPDALFNAASDFEKSNQYDKATEVYEILVSKYSDSDKAKDALFNVGFCYEKLGKLEKMAEANERYSQRYPEEKDVEVMLIRSAGFYFKAGMNEKAKNAFKNFIRQFSKSPRSVEAYYMLGKCCLNDKDKHGAVDAFAQAEAQNKRLIESGLEANNFFAAEAAFSTASIKRDNFSAVSFSAGGKDLKDQQKQKSNLLADAAKAYQRVMQYKSERMFEAAYYIGKMYADFTLDWRDQKRVEKDPIKAALAEKDIQLVASTLMQKSFGPLKKVIELASNIDSLGTEQAKWKDSAQISLADNYLMAGEYLVAAVKEMNNAPIPKEIKEQPLYLYQYLKQLLETLEPLKGQARDYFLNSFKEMSDLNLKESKVLQCREEFARINFIIPNDYESLAERILVSADKLPSDIDEEEREDLIFQFEDLVFELQDRALLAYEDAMNLAKQEGVTDSKWYGKIMERLARLSPDTYGAGFYKKLDVVTDNTWLVRPDSVENWNTKKLPLDGWQAADMMRKRMFADFPEGNPKVIWREKGNVGRLFIVKPIFINGIVREAKIYFALQGKYVFYINGTNVAADTSKRHILMEMDSLGGIASLFKGGDNILAVDITVPDTVYSGIAMVFSAMVDTSENFTSSLRLPEIKGIAAIMDGSGGTDFATAQSEAETDTVGGGTRVSYAQQFKNRGELLNAITDYEKRAQETQMKIKRERMEIQKLRIKEDWLIKMTSEVKKEIAELKKRLEGMGREK